MCHPRYCRFATLRLARRSQGAERMRRTVLIMALLMGAACEGTSEGPDSGPDALPSCWIHDCPSDPGAFECGTCSHHFADHECPPGFVCSCGLICVRGPRLPDGGVCIADWDAGLDPTEPDAAIFDWPICQE
jgi:hypothetical protein